MSDFRKWLVEKRDFAALLATEAEEAERFDEWEGFDGDRAMWTDAITRYDAEHPAHDPPTGTRAEPVGKSFEFLDKFEREVIAARSFGCTDTELGNLIRLFADDLDAERARLVVLGNEVVAAGERLVPMAEDSEEVRTGKALLEWRKAQGEWLKATRPTAQEKNDE